MVKYLSQTVTSLVLMLAVSLLAGCKDIEPTSSASPSPYIILVTATPRNVTPTPTLLVIGPFGPTFVPDHELTPLGAEPTIDLSSVTLIPTPNATTGVTATPTPLTIAATPSATVVPIPAETGSPRLGLNFIHSPHLTATRSRTEAGLETGAGWDRFPIYWNEIEREPDQYDWTDYDRAVRSDMMAGLRTNAILLGTPARYADERSVPQQIEEPVFSDGTDIPGSDKTINADNPWAAFVYEAVRRYRPGGVRAVAEGWPTGRGIRVWEVWNEPDSSFFWGGTVEEYARLVKVAYLAARHADPEARIMLGGLLMFERPGFLAELLNVYRDDPSPVDGTYPFHSVAVHSYSHPPDTFRWVQSIESLLAIYGIGDREIWVNESGVPVWDDYPGPTWATQDQQIQWRATQDEQASYVIQNAAYAFMAGADVVFHFQLYDDCGNQPAGTTFPPHDGSLCTGGAVCWGDALGLMRNPARSVCFNQHPQPDTPRPAYAAFRTVGEVFGAGDIVPLAASRGPYGDQVWLMFTRPAQRQLISVLWSENGAATEAWFPAHAGEGTLVNRDGERTQVAAQADGLYHIPLLPATNTNQAGVLPTSWFMIGGPPVILLEESSQPVVSVLPLLETSRPAFLVKWQSSDPSLDLYEIWYKDETSGGDWTRWFETTSPGEAIFVGGEGRTYSFFARGRSLDGVWTIDTPTIQARTTLD